MHSNCSCTVQESMRVNLNALGDRVVSFAVLALSVSPNGSMVAACTDRSRVIVLQVPQRQIWNTKSQKWKAIENMGQRWSTSVSFIFSVASGAQQPSTSKLVWCFGERRSRQRFANKLQLQTAHRSRQIMTDHERL